MSANNTKNGSPKDIKARVEYSHKQNVIHNALRDIAESIVKHADTEKDEATLNAYCKYMFRYYKFLHEHHDHEEELIFPAYKKWVVGTEVEEQINALMKKLSTEHDELLADLETLKKLTENETITAENAKIAAETVKKINNFISPHFQEEDDNNFEKMNVGSARDIHRLLSQIEKDAKADISMLPFVVLAIPVERRDIMGLPPIIGPLLFRSVANGRNLAPLLQFSPYPTKNRSGKYVLKP